MKIAVIGAGFTGLAAAYDLARAGHQVTVYEANDIPGGLAAGFSSTDWRWSLEHHYHHIFTSDKNIIDWLKEVGLSNTLFFSRVKTSTYFQGKTFQLDSPLSLLLCPVLSLIAKLRTAATLGFLKLWPFWQILEHFTAKDFLLKTMGKESWQVLWEPLFTDKFGRFAGEVNAAWFWARIKARTPALGYFKGGFGELAKAAVSKLEALGVEFHFSTPVAKINPVNAHWQVVVESSVKSVNQIKPNLSFGRNNAVFDAVLFTGDAELLKKLVPSLSAEFRQKISKLNSLAARTLVLELDQPFFKDQTYWLNINQADWPFLAVVEHTRLAGKDNYGGKTLLYVGKYLEVTDNFYAITKLELLAKYRPYLEKLCPGFSQSVTNIWDFKSRFAQPVTKIGHSPNVPPLCVPLPGLYWASMQHVYPWDRGTNFAVKIGRKVAEVMLMRIQ